MELKDNNSLSNDHLSEDGELIASKSKRSEEKEQSSEEDEEEEESIPVYNEYKQRNIILWSFGWKYGPPKNTLHCFNLRKLRSPPSSITKKRNGTSKEFTKIFFEMPGIESFYQGLISKILELINQQEEKEKGLKDEEKQIWQVGIGCNIGRHRSVAMVERLERELNDRQESKYFFIKYHRDIDK